MPPILKDFSKDQVIQAMIANNNGLLRHLDNLPGSERGVEGGAEWFLTGVPFPLFNGVLSGIMPNEAIDQSIDSILHIFRRRDLPMIWSVTPASRPRDIGRYLLAHGLRHAGDAPSMACDLNGLPAGPSFPDGVVIQSVRDEATLLRWCQVLVAVFEFPAFVSQALFEVMAIIGFEPDAQVKNYVGLEGSHVTCVSTLVLAGGVAGIYNVGTIPQHRRRGLGRAITLAPLLEARDLGYRLGVLQSTEMGYPVYSALGFIEYCQFGRYLWLPKVGPGA